MKKLSLLLVAIISLVVVGCGSEEQAVDYEAEMKVLANQIFEDHFIKDNGVDIYQVDIEGVRNLGNYGYEYELGNLENCTNESRVDLHINKDTFEVDEYEFFLNCK